MMLASVLGVGALAILANAQTDQVTPTPFLSTITTTARSTGTRARTATGVPTAIATHTVAVGATGFAFSPAKVDANVGDMIEWVFYPDGHSVIRAEFGFPCTPYEYIDVGREGFYSGPQPVKAITNDMPRYSVRVNDTDPIFFYCGAPGSCYKEKMIGVINENSTQTLGDQLEAAQSLTTQILPGEPFPTESDDPKSSGGSGSGAVVNNYHHSLGGGQIAGIVIGAVAFLFLAGVLVYMCGRRGGLDRAYRRSAMAYQAPPQPPPQTVTEINYSAQPKNAASQGWRNSYHSALGGPYRDQVTQGGHSPAPISPPFPGFSHPVNGMQTYYDHRISSIAPSTIAEAPNTQPAAPIAPAVPPVELPTSKDPESSPLPKYLSRFASSVRESGYRPSKGT